MTNVIIKAFKVNDNTLKGWNTPVVFDIVIANPSDFDFEIWRVWQSLYFMLKTYGDRHGFFSKNPRDDIYKNKNQEKNSHYFYV